MPCGEGMCEYSVCGKTCIQNPIAGKPRNAKYKSGSIILTINGDFSISFRDYIIHVAAGRGGGKVDGALARSSKKSVQCAI